MGIDYDFSLAVGYRFTGAELEQRFGKTVEPTYTTERRFDPRTGKRVADEQVVTSPGGFSLVCGDQEFDCVESLVEYLASEVGAVYHTVGSYMSDEMDFIIGPKLPSESTEGMEDGKVTCMGGVHFSAVADMRPELGRIQDQLFSRFDLKCDPAEVAIAWTIS